jgi:hypothetical protein
MAERRIKLNQNIIDALGDDRCTVLAEAIMFAEQFEDLDDVLFERITDLMGDIADHYKLTPDDMATYTRTVVSCYVSGI